MADDLGRHAKSIPVCGMGAKGRDGGGRVLWATRLGKACLGDEEMVVCRKDTDTDRPQIGREGERDSEDGRVKSKVVVHGGKRGWPSDYHQTGSMGQGID
jgi:hypothetical protein